MGLFTTPLWQKPQPDVVYAVRQVGSSQRSFCKLLFYNDLQN